MGKRIFHTDLILTGEKADSTKAVIEACCCISLASGFYFMNSSSLKETLFLTSSIKIGF